MLSSPPSNINLDKAKHKGIVCDVPLYKAKISFIKLLPVPRPLIFFYHHHRGDLLCPYFLSFVVWLSSDIFFFFFPFFFLSLS